MVLGSLFPVTGHCAFGLLSLVTRPRSSVYRLLTTGFSPDAFSRIALARVESCCASAGRPVWSQTLARPRASLPWRERSDVLVERDFARRPSGFTQQ